MHNYYGRIEDKIIPKKKAIHFMIDEFIKNSIEAECKNFKHELDIIRNNFKADLKEDIKVLKRQLKEAEDRIILLEKQNKIILSKLYPEENKEDGEKVEVKEKVERKKPVRSKGMPLYMKDAYVEEKENLKKILKEKGYKIY